VLSRRNPPIPQCWGDSTDFELIRLGEETVKVGRNLLQAIQDVRNASSVRSSAGFLLWADALCINQGDNEERSQQVRNMRQIYSRAAEVFCWVGATSDPSALDRVVQNRVLSQHNREIVCDFFSQPYWRRVWIIQEIAVSSNVTLLWVNPGDTVYNRQKRIVELPWSLVAKFVKYLMRETEGSASERRELGRLPLHLLEIRDRFMDKREPIHLLDAIEWTIETLSTDPRDKIFALLGLCHDGPTFVPVPNYQQPKKLPEVVNVARQSSISIEDDHVNMRDILGRHRRGRRGRRGSRGMLKPCALPLDLLKTMVELLGMDIEGVTELEHREENKTSKGTLEGPNGIEIANSSLVR
jgi:hypothetical protein